MKIYKLIIFLIFVSPIYIFGQSRFLLSDSISESLSNPISNQFAKENKIQKVIKRTIIGDTNNIPFEFKEFYYYNQFGCLDSVIEFSISQSKKYEKKQISLINDYDILNHLIQSTLKSNASSGIVKSINNYIYYSDTLTQLIKNDYYADNKDTQAYYTIAHNEFGLLTKFIEYDTNKNIRILTLYEYYENKLPKSIIRKDNDGKIWTHYFYNHKFNKNGRVVKISSDEKSNHTFKAQAEYNHLNQCTKVHTTHYIKTKIDSYFDFSYNKDGSLAWCKETTDYGNKKIGIKWYKFEYFKD